PGRRSGAPCAGRCGRSGHGHGRPAARLGSGASVWPVSPPLWRRLFWPDGGVFSLLPVSRLYRLSQLCRLWALFSPQLFSALFWPVSRPRLFSLPVFLVSTL